MSNNIPLIASDFSMRYINLVKQDPVQEALKKNTAAWLNLMEGMPADKIDYAYATGKWTVKQVLQHVTDTERVFSFRAIWFARKSGTPLPGFEENDWAEAAPVSARDWNDMIREFRVLRQSTEIMFDSFAAENLEYTGIASNSPINVYSVGYLCAGHVQHHINILNERYL